MNVRFRNPSELSHPPLPAGHPARLGTGNWSPLRLRRRSGTYRCAGLSYTDHPEATILGLRDPTVWESTRPLAVSAQSAPKPHKGADERRILRCC